jgi:hypothetical protein
MSEGIENAQVREALIHAIDTAAGDIDAVRTNLQHWFDSAMDRVSGWYKRRSQRIVFVLGLLTAVGLNVNTITIAQSLSTSAALRQAVIAQAQTMENAVAPCASGAPCDLTPSGAVQEMSRTDVPIGWNDTAISALLAPTKLYSCLGWFEIITGYLLTAFAVTLGAPFWFDVLNRLMVIRATVKPAEKSPEEASQDPQPEDNAASPPKVVPPAKPGGGNAGCSTAAPTVDTDIIYAEMLGVADRIFEGDDGTTHYGVTADGQIVVPKALPQKDTANAESVK